MLWCSFFCWRTFRPRKYGWDSRRFKCFLATCKQTDVIWWLKMARANSRVLCHLKIYLDISSNCNIAGTHLRRLETYEKKFSRHFPHTLSWYSMEQSNFEAWSHTIIICYHRMILPPAWIPRFHAALPRSIRSTAILELGVYPRLTLPIVRKALC